MSNEALTWAFRQGAPSTGAKFVLVALADMANHEHRAWPGQSKLAAMTGQGQRTVVRHLQQLEAAGLIERERRNEGFTKRLPDGFRLPVQVAAGTPAKRTRASVTPAKSAPVAAEPPGIADPQTRAKLAPVNLTHASGDEDTCQTGRLKEPKEQPTTKSPTRGTRLPADWVRSPGDKEWQSAEGIPDEFARQHTAEFRDYWIARPGTGGVKLDWSATWRNWMRRAWRERAGQDYRRDHGQQAAVRDFDAERTRAREAARFNPPAWMTGGQTG